MTKTAQAQQIITLQAELHEARATIASLTIQARVLDQHITALLRQVAPVLVPRADIEAQIAFEQQYGPHPQ